MLRLLLVEVLLFLAPWIVWWIWWRVKFGYEPRLCYAPRQKLLGVGLVIVFLGLVPLSHSYYMWVPKGELTYVPTTVVGNELVPGHFVEELPHNMKHEDKFKDKT